MKKYFEFVSGKMKENKLKPLTVTKKFRELHSFAAYCVKNTSAVEKDYFISYLKLLEKEKKNAKSVSVRHMDALLKAASENPMEYSILVLMYRAGLSSTEITAINDMNDFISYDGKIFLKIRKRKELCRIPDDAWEILQEFVKIREKHESFFYNSRGHRLNTMYISRMMKKYCKKAGIPFYSAESVRNCCAFNLFSYGAKSAQVAEYMGVTQQQIQRYNDEAYKNRLIKQPEDLVKIRIEKP